MRTLLEILNQAAKDVAILADNGALFGRCNEIDLQKASKLLNAIVKELDDTNAIELR
jgi:hypothetical protein